MEKKNSEFTSTIFKKRVYEIMMLNFKGAINIIFALENFLAVKIFAKY